MIAPDEGMYAFDQMLRHARTYTGYIPIIGAPWLADLVRRSPWAEMFQSSGQNTRGPSKFLAELKLLPQEEWAGRLRRLIAEQASVILRRTVDADRPFVEYGLDSLGMLEMRTHIETETGCGCRPRSSPAITLRVPCRSIWPTHWPRKKPKPRRHNGGSVAL